MKYIKFSGHTEWEGTSYEDYRVLPDEVTNHEINILSKQYAIENAAQYSWMFERDNEDTELSDEDYNEAYQDFLSTSIDNSKWTILTEEAFNRAIDEIEY